MKKHTHATVYYFAYFFEKPKNKGCIEINELYPIYIYFKLLLLKTTEYLEPTYLYFVYMIVLLAFEDKVLKFQLFAFFNEKIKMHTTLLLE